MELYYAENNDQIPMSSMNAGAATEELQGSMDWIRRFLPPYQLLLYMADQFMHSAICPSIRIINSLLF